MSEQDSEILKLIEAGKAIDRKWNIYKILTVIGCFLGSVLWIGAQYGDWRQWRSDVDIDRVEMRSHIQTVQGSKNPENAKGHAVQDWGVRW